MTFAARKTETNKPLLKQPPRHLLQQRASILGAYDDLIDVNGRGSAWHYREDNTRTSDQSRS